MVQGRGSTAGMRAAIPQVFYQCRITPELPRKFKDHPVHYDSTLIFPVKEMAEKYMEMFIEQLKELKLLKDKQKYESSVIDLATFLPEV